MDTIESEFLRAFRTLSADYPRLSIRQTCDILNQRGYCKGKFCSECMLHSPRVLLEKIDKKDVEQ